MKKDLALWQNAWILRKAMLTKNILEKEKRYGEQICIE